MSKNIPPLQESVSPTHQKVSARRATNHWWAQRVTALFLVPLSVWMVILLINSVGGDYATYLTLFHSPLAASVLFIWILAAFYHADLGLAEVIQDYVEPDGLKLVVQQITRLVLGLFAVLSVFCLLKLFLGK